MLEEEAANKKSIEEEIEEERAKVDAKTPITQAVFEQWRQKKKDDRQKAVDQAEVERKRKGVMTGREIFAQVIPIWNLKAGSMQMVTHPSWKFCLSRFARPNGAVKASVPGCHRAVYCDAKL